MTWMRGARRHWPEDIWDTAMAVLSCRNTAREAEEECDWSCPRDSVAGMASQASSQKPWAVTAWEPGLTTPRWAVELYPGPWTPAGSAVLEWEPRVLGLSQTEASAPQTWVTRLPRVDPGQVAAGAEAGESGRSSVTPKPHLHPGSISLDPDNQAFHEIVQVGGRGTNMRLPLPPSLFSGQR